MAGVTPADPLGARRAAARGETAAAAAARALLLCDTSSRAPCPMPDPDAPANGSLLRKKSRFLGFRSADSNTSTTDLATLPQRANTHGASHSSHSSISNSRRDSSISSLTDVHSSIRRRSTSLRSPRGADSPTKDILAFSADSRSESTTSLKPSLTVATYPYSHSSVENLGTVDSRGALPLPLTSDGRSYNEQASRRGPESGRPPATSHGIIGRDRGESTTTFSSSLAPSASVAPSLDNQRIQDMCTKRINTLEYLRKAHEGRVYWFNTMLFNKRDLSKMPYFEEAKLTRRAMNYLLLGLSLPYQLDPQSRSPVEFLRAFNTLLTEFETYQTAHPPEGGAGSSLARVRMGQMFKRAASGTGSKRRPSGGDALSPPGDGDMRAASGASGYGALPGTKDELLPGEEYSFLLTPSLPFEPDYYETFATLCDVLIDCYTKITSFVNGPETEAQSVAELGVLFSKADSKVRKILVASVIRDFEDSSKQGLRSELAGVGKVVLGGLM